jgi:ribosomal RNA-processing protein 9
MSRVRKKKINTVVQPSPATKKKQKTVDLGWNGREDEHIDSDEDDDDQYRGGASLHDDDEEEAEEEEALDAKRVRLARQYLQKLEGGDSDDSSSGEDSDDDNEQGHGDHDRIGMKLQRERLKREGVLERAVADKVAKSLELMRQSFPSPKNASATTNVEEEVKQWIEAGQTKLLRGHDLTPTCVALQSSGETAISGSKDHSVLMWDVENEKRAFTLCSPWNKKGSDTTVSRTNGEVLSVACSDDGRYAAVGRRDATVSIFDIRAGRNSLVKTFTGHKGAVTCLGFRSGSSQLFSGSDDRCIR